MKLAASGKVASGAAMAMNAALGADWCNAARPFMFALGCVQSMRCHTDTCPTGVATQSLARQRGLVVPDKAQRVANFHQATVHALHEMVVAAGLDSPDDFRPWHLRQRINVAEMRQMDEIYPFVEEGALVAGEVDPKTALGRWWRMPIRIRSGGLGRDSPSPSRRVFRCNRPPDDRLTAKTGAVEKTRTSTAFRPQRPQRCASTSSATTARDVPEETLRPVGSGPLAALRALRNST